MVDGETYDVPIMVAKHLNQKLLVSKTYPHSRYEWSTHGKSGQESTEM